MNKIEELLERERTVCGATKPVADFNTRPDRPSGYRSECRKCQYRRQYKGQKRKKRKPHVARAYNISHYAKRKGNVVPAKACQGCGNVGRLQMHHPDYGEPLNIVWLCAKCHTAEHRSIKIA